MLKEDLSIYTDGNQTDETDVATVVSSIDNTVIFQDDGNDIFFLSADPESFETGTVEQKSALIPIESAEPQLKERIYAALKKEGS